MSSNWFPEIMYEEDSKIPFVPVPADEVMPQILFMFESRETGEYEPGHEGEPSPIVQMDLHQYANMVVLKEGLTGPEFDKVREVLGLEPLQVAIEKGQKVSLSVKNTIEQG